MAENGGADTCRCVFIGTKPFCGHCGKPFPRADLAAPDAAQKVAQEIVPACLSRTCFIKDCGRDRCWGCDDSVLERKRVAEIISRHFAIDADADRQARRETWNSVISKLNERAEDWRLQAERWQKQAENETNEAIRDLSFSDRDACLSKMSALKTFAIEAAALRAEGEKGK